MPFWKSEDKNTAAGSPSETASSQKSVEAGGLPLLAMRRIQSEAQDPSRRFTSDLSVNEFFFAKHVGCEPVSQVMGSSIYHVGWQYQPYYSSTELTTLTHAYFHARTLALSRLQQEAKLLGAHGVIGVRITDNVYEWAQDLVEFVAIGAAVRIAGAAKTDTPFISDLSGQDYWALHVNGLRPLGVAYGNCVWYQVASWMTQAAQNPGSTPMGGYGLGYGASMMNQELVDFTQAVNHARRVACERMEAEAKVFGAEGVVGVNIVDDITPHTVSLGNDQERTDLIARFQAMGTAVAHYDRGMVQPIDYTLQLAG